MKFAKWKWPIRLTMVLSSVVFVVFINTDNKEMKLNNFRITSVSPTSIALKNDEYLKQLGISTTNHLNADISPTSEHTLPVIITACSAEFFYTLQGLLKNLNIVRSVFPEIQIVFYDLGLRTRQKALMLRYCKCEVKMFPFERFPPHVKDLRLYAWKPILIQLALNEYGFVMYMDTSIRLTSSINLASLFQHAINTGFLYTKQDHPRFTLVEHTDRRTFEYLGEIPCMFHGVPDRQAGFILMTRYLFIQQLIMRPWLGCVLEPECLVPQGARERYVCDTRLHWYGKCHRYDQSILNIVVSRLYHPPRDPPFIPSDSYVIRRREHIEYFPPE